MPWYVLFLFLLLYFELTDILQKALVGSVTGTVTITRAAPTHANPCGKIQVKTGLQFKARFNPNRAGAEAEESGELDPQVAADEDNDGDDDN